jgi:hypothetical protein
MHTVCMACSVQRACHTVYRHRFGVGPRSRQSWKPVTRIRSGRRARTGSSSAVDRRMAHAPNDDETPRARARRMNFRAQAWGLRTRNYCGCRVGNSRWAQCRANLRRRAPRSRCTRILRCKPQLQPQPLLPWLRPMGMESPHGSVCAGPAPVREVGRASADGPTRRCSRVRKPSLCPCPCL